MVGRRLRMLVTVAVVAVLFVPVAIDRDSLPLSTYPMYSSARSTTSTIVTAQVVTTAGEVRPLSMATIGESDDPLIVAGELRAAVRNGEAVRRCAEIASRVTLRASGVRVEIVSETHDTVDFVADRDSLLDRTVHASCVVSP